MHKAQALDLLVKLLAVAVLVLLNGFFVAAEFALVRIRDTQLDELARKGQRRAKIARHILRHLSAYLSATQLGITVASLGLGWVGEPVFRTLLTPLFDALEIGSHTARQSISFAVGFSAITFLHITVGELAPRWLAIQKPLTCTLAVAPPLHAFYVVSYPFAWVLNRTAQWLLRQVGLSPADEAEHGYSESELRLLFRTSQERLGTTKLGRDIVLNALELRHRRARDVMRPRHEIVALNTEATIAQCLDVAEKTRYSRFPLCEKGDLDKTLGVVHIKDLYAMRFKARTGADLASVARKLVYAPETARLEKLLDTLLQRRTHMAIVVDEYGTTTGLVTLENILEELVGQIQDEFDIEKPLVTRLADDAWELAGQLPLHELAELTGLEFRAEGIATVSGLVTHKLGGFPKPGDTLRLGEFELRVEETDGLRVARLRLTRLKDQTECAS
ncbi:MAG: hemolysin family protein [Verrucomicrobiae bacterium]|nr:hemolysin family protein [Verrucomicrobiae bacterium]MDW7980009.1 hemolysin family protein [Verrucomicrobiales bacterium]